MQHAPSSGFSILPGLAVSLAALQCSVHRGAKCLLASIIKETLGILVAILCKSLRAGFTFCIDRHGRADGMEVNAVEDSISHASRR